MEESSCYNFSNEKRGIALLINNEYFFRSSGYKDRPGDDVDHRRMKKIFKRLGFNVYSYRDLTKNEILKTAMKVANEEDFHNKSDCFVCVVGSHGEERQIDTGAHSKSHDREHCIVGVDGKLLRTSKLIEVFDDNNCDGLQGKPKFFFIQACRIRQYPGAYDGMDKGYIIPVPSTIGNMGEKEEKPEEKFDGMVDGQGDTGDEESEIDSDDDFQRDELDSSDTEDDEDFIEFKKKSGDEIGNRKSPNMTRGDRKKRIEELDAIGRTPEGKLIDLEKLDKSQPMQVLSDNNTAQDPKSTQAIVQTHVKISQARKKSSHQIVPMVTIVPCSENTLIMFASLSGNFAVRILAEGGWLLSTLYNVLKDYTKDLDEFQNTNFLEVLSKVLTVLSKETFQPKKTGSRAHLAGCFSPGCITHRLVKDVYFTKKPSKRKLYQKILDFFVK